jgi:hypothetical protein
VAEKGQGKNEVAQPVNPAANVAANAPANPAANTPASDPANVAGNVVNNTANASNAQANVAPNPGHNAGAQPPLIQANRAEGSQHHCVRDEVEIAQRADYDCEHGVPDALDANNPIQATELRIMHDQELLRRAQYDQDNGPPDDLYVIPVAHAPSASPEVFNNFPAFSRLWTIRYPKDFKPAIEKYDGRSDPSIWLKMYSIAARASCSNEDHMARYFPLVMGKAPLLWLDNLPVDCITSWATLSRLFTTNYQATYNRPGNTHHLARVRMRSDEILREYTNRYFENRNTLAGVKDEDVIVYYKKGITNIKLFEKIHEADAHTIGDLMAYVDKLVDTQDAVMHDFNREDHDDRGTRSRKRSGEPYVADPPRPSTFLKGDFNMVMDDQCQFHRDAKHTMRECEQLKSALGVSSTSKKTKSNDDRKVVNASTIVTVDLIDEITVIVDPILAMIIGTDVIITATITGMTDATTTTLMTDAMTTVATTTTKGVTTTGVIVAMIVMMITATTDVTTDVPRMAITAKTATVKSGHRRHCPNGATPTVDSRRPTVR